MFGRNTAVALVALLPLGAHAAPVDANFICPESVSWTEQTVNSTLYSFSVPEGLTAIQMFNSETKTPAKSGKGAFAGIFANYNAGPGAAMSCLYRVGDAGATVRLALPYKQCVLAREGVVPRSPVMGTDPKALALGCADGPAAVLIPAAAYPTVKPVIATKDRPFVCPAQFPYDPGQQRFRPDPASGLAIMEAVPASSGVARFQGVNNVALPLNATSCLYIDNVSVRQANGTFTGQAKVYGVRVPGNCRLLDPAATANRQHFNPNPAALPIVCN